MVEALPALASAAGFNLVGVVAVEAFDAAAPPESRIRTVLGNDGVRSVIVIGCGGTGFWEIFKGRRPGARPDELAAADGSIDAYSRPVVNRLAHEVNAQGAAAEPVFPFAHPGRSLSFRRLAEYAGFGTAGTVLTILLYPTYGPWVSLRGAIATDALLPAMGPLDGFDPCLGCPRPCAAACPAVTFDGPSWDWDACLRYRVIDDGCPTGCLARLACPIGAHSRYSGEEYAYRHAFAPERLASLRARYRKA
ncbi:MAG: hypothetical protein FJ029_12340 [Actinobacteria bacterium]|nr:hypothetical protein [Actinomycetota bacterium]